MRLTSPTHLPKAPSLNRLASTGLAFEPVRAAGVESTVPVRGGEHHDENLNSAKESA
jgi:hypothetical protein